MYIHTYICMYICMYLSIYLIGEGSVGAVYHGTLVASGKNVAVKVYPLRSAGSTNHLK